MKNICIKDIYTGKPDANDEISIDGLEQFINSFITPTSIIIDEFIKSSNCFISGYKGSGKTALLFYIDNYIKEKDESACSIFVLFKKHFNETHRQEMKILAQHLVTYISLQQDLMLNFLDFEYIWRWVLFKNIIDANEKFNNGIFVCDNNWDQFKSLIERINGFSNPQKYTFSPKFKITIPDPNITSELEVNLLEKENSYEYRCFTSIIDKAEEYFKTLVRTDIPLFVFVDELEAYYGNEEIFHRDLYLIRDLLLTVKRFNTIFYNWKHSSTRIICSVRSEIINAINRYIVTKELNKAISGFELPLIWDYSNTNSYEHPILKILIRRIGISIYEKFGAELTEKKIISDWFPKKISGIDTARFILNNSWFKPRDIVRLLLAAKSCNASNNSSFSQAVFDQSIKKYSEDSLDEIREEMKALYAPVDIDIIFSCLNGYKPVFSLNEIKARAKSYFEGSIIDQKTNDVLCDLYRLGVIGNYSQISKNYRWQHKSNNGLILTGDWQMMIHRALQNALSTNNVSIPNIGDTVIASVYKITPQFVLVTFIYRKRQHRGSIHISKLSSGYIYNLNTFTRIGDTYEAQIIGHNQIYNSWDLAVSNYNDKSITNTNSLGI